MKPEKIYTRRDSMVVLNVRLDNFYAFKDFHMNLTYPKKIVESYIPDEHLENFPNFRYKKVNIIMGANASGKTTLGLMLRDIFNLLHRQNYSMITDAVNDQSREASFEIDLVCKSSTLYNITCTVSPEPEQYNIDDIKLEIRKEAIRPRDSYESCIKRLKAAPYTPCANYLEELERLEGMAWLFEFPADSGDERILLFKPGNKRFLAIMENILRALDPSIQKVEPSKDADDAYVIRLLNGESVIIQSGAALDTERLSSGTKAGVEVAMLVSALVQGHNGFYYCDEKFSYIHSDIEKAILSVMIDSICPNEQLFFTTHNTDILTMNLPKHTFTFLRKDPNDTAHPISCVSASSLLKRSSDSLKNAVENDLFSTAPALDLIYAIPEI